MYITYHIEVTKPLESFLSLVPHTILDKQIKNFIEDNLVTQEAYYTRCNGHYFFIYLDNGDRIDIQL